MGQSHRREKTESNGSVWNRLHKMVLDNEGEINCSYCPYHRVENASRDCRRSWKYFRTTQYKPKKGDRSC